MLPLVASAERGWMAPARQQERENSRRRGSSSLTVALTAIGSACTSAPARSLSAMGIWPAITELLPELRAYGRSISANSADAEDLVSDAIERAVNSDAAPASKPALKAWLFRIMRNLSIDGFRRARTHREYIRAQERLFGHAGQAGASLEERLTLRAALTRLKPAERQMIMLIDIVGLSYGEAAHFLDVPIGTVMSRISRARRALMREIDGTSRTGSGDVGRSGT